MKKIIANLRGFIFNIQVKICDWKINNLQNEIVTYNEQILNMICEGKSENTINKLRDIRDTTYDVRYDLIGKKNTMKKVVIEV